MEPSWCWCLLCHWLSHLPFLTSDSISCLFLVPPALERPSGGRPNCHGPLLKPLGPLLLAYCPWRQCPANSLDLGGWLGVSFWLLFESSSVHPSVCPSLYSYTRLPIHPFVHPFIHPFTHTFTNLPLTHSLIHPVYLSIHSSIHSPNLPLTHSSILSICPSIHPYIHPTSHSLTRPSCLSVHLSL